MYHNRKNIVRQITAKEDFIDGTSPTYNVMASIRRLSIHVMRVDCPPLRLEGIHGG